MTNFNGHLIIGGTITPAVSDMSDLPSSTTENNVIVNADQIIIPSALNIGSAANPANLTILANNVIDIQDDITTGSTAANVGGGGVLSLLAGAGAGGSKTKGVIKATGGVVDLGVSSGFFCGG